MNKQTLPTAGRRRRPCVQKAKDGVFQHFDTGDCVAVDPRTGMPIICPCSSLCSNCNSETRKALAEVWNG